MTFEPGWLVPLVAIVLVARLWWLTRTADRLREHEVEQLRAAVGHDPEDIVVLNWQNGEG